MPETKHHTITVTQVPDEESDDVVWTVQCPGVTVYSGCQLWWQCLKAKVGVSLGQQRDGTVISRDLMGCPHDPTEEEDDEGEYEAHDEHHERIDGEWMVPTNDCALQSDQATDYLYEIARYSGLGTWPISVSYEGDGEWYVERIPEEVK